MQCINVVDWEPGLYLHFTWKCGSWLIKEFWKNINFWKNDSRFSTEMSKLTLVNQLWNYAFSGMEKIDLYKYCPLIHFVLTIVCIVCRWYFDHFWRPWLTQKTIFASINQSFNGKLPLFLTEVNFDTSEENQLSYFQKWIFFKSSLVSQ